MEHEALFLGRNQGPFCIASWVHDVCVLRPHEASCVREAEGPVLLSFLVQGLG